MENKEIFIEPWIEKRGWDKKSLEKVVTPTYVLSISKLEKNLEITNVIQKETGVKILMALKSFSMFSVFPLIKKYLAGTEASSVNEARLGYEEFKKEVHVFSPAYTDENIKEYLKYASHLVFNSFSQWHKFKALCLKKKISCGLRVNLEHSESDHSQYDPSRPFSQFGITQKNFEKDIAGLEGLHFHNLCELNADALERSLKVFEEKFSQFFPKLKWVNFGGGHHLTRSDYNQALLIKIIKKFKNKYPHLEIYLEPGEAIALNAGVLVGQVIDIFQNDMNIAIIDISATTHMPDVLEMPYLPTILDAQPAQKNSKNVYSLAGPSCLTGDIIGTYSFPQKLKIGQKIIFMNMAIYTMVKNNTFNGINLPNIALMDEKGKIKIIKKFNYQDFKNRLS